MSWQGRHLKRQYVPVSAMRPVPPRGKIIVESAIEIVGFKWNWRYFRMEVHIATNFGKEALMRRGDQFTQVQEINL